MDPHSFFPIGSGSRHIEVTLKTQQYNIYEKVCTFKAKKIVKHRHLKEISI
jgi:hypothetical protein